MNKKKEFKNGEEWEKEFDEKNIVGNTPTYQKIIIKGFISRQIEKARKAKESANLSAYFLARDDERKANFAYKIANAWIKLMRK